MCGRAEAVLLVALHLSCNFKLPLPTRQGSSGDEGSIVRAKEKQAKDQAEGGANKAHKHNSGNGEEKKAKQRRGGTTEHGQQVQPKRARQDKPLSKSPASLEA